jgi:hypothetical protein
LEFSVMILSIDFGGAVAKTLKVTRSNHQQGLEFELSETPLGFKTRPRWTIPEALEFIIRKASDGQKADAVYASGEIASTKLKKILTEPPLDPVVVYQKLNLPVIDVGHSLTYVLGKSFRGQVDAAQVSRYLPFELTTTAIDNCLGNEEIYPQAVPVGTRVRQLKRAAARVKIQTAFGESGTFDTEEIILSGAVLAKAEDPSLSLLVILDALCLPPLVRVFLDQKQMLLALATLAFFEEDLANKILEQEPLTLLGSVFSHPEEVSLQIDLGLPQPQQLEIGVGELVRVPLETGKTAKVVFESRKASGELEIEGGTVGLVVDTRPKPLNLSVGRHERLGLLKKWREALCVSPLSKK